MRFIAVFTTLLAVAVASPARGNAAASAAADDEGTLGVVDPASLDCRCAGAGNTAVCLNSKTCSVQQVNNGYNDQATCVCDVSTYLRRSSPRVGRQRR